MAANEKKRKRIVYAIFIVAVIWGVYNQPWKRPDRSGKGPDPAGIDASAAAQAAAAAVNTSPVSADWVAVDKWTVDPFRPISSRAQVVTEEEPEPSVMTPQLQGIMTVGSRVLCVLDGQVRRVGDQIGSWRVTAIENGTVTVAGSAGESVQLSSQSTRVIEK